MATTLPSISGGLQEGNILTADPGVWTGAANGSRTYLWLRCVAAAPDDCTPTGITTQTYQVTDADLTAAASAMRVEVTAPGLTTPGTARSAPSLVNGYSKVAIAPPGIDAGPGGPRVGVPITSTPAVWSAMPPTTVAPTLHFQLCSTAAPTQLRHRPDPRRHVHPDRPLRRVLHPRRQRHQLRGLPERLGREGEPVGGHRTDPAVRRRRDRDDRPHRRRGEPRQRRVDPDHRQRHRLRRPRLPVGADQWRSAARRGGRRQVPRRHGPGDGHRHGHHPPHRARRPQQHGDDRHHDRLGQHRRAGRAVPGRRRGADLRPPADLWQLPVRLPLRPGQPADLQRRQRRHHRQRDRRPRSDGCSCSRRR